MECLERIKELLKERGWSMYQLSQRSAIPQSTLSNLFLRNNAPTIPTLEKICDALGITLAEFFGKENELSDEETEVLRKWRILSPKNKQLFLELLEVFSSK